MFQLEQTRTQYPNLLKKIILNNILKINGNASPFTEGQGTLPFSEAIHFTLLVFVLDSTAVAHRTAFLIIHCEYTA
jgi:hypothetical protein